MPQLVIASELDTHMGKLTALVSYLEREIGYVENGPLTDEEMRMTILRGTEWLLNAQEQDGHFRYEYAPYEDIDISDDNSVRQAGALYQLGEILRRDREKTLELRKPIETAISYFERESYTDTFSGFTFRCVMTSEHDHRCKLGATSLALTGILSYLEVYPEERDTYDELVEDYIRFIKASKNEGAGFRNVYRVGQDLQSGRESSFSNGEVLLALVRYYQYQEDPEIEKLAHSLYGYLEEKEFDTPLYLWIMAALKDMQNIWPDSRYVTYAKKYTDWRMTGVAAYKSTQHNYCAYTEGVTSAYLVLKDVLEVPQLQELRAEIDFWNRKNRTLQVEAGVPYRYVRKDEKLVLNTIPNMEKAQGGFLTGQEELTQRIDFTQHCLSAYLQTFIDIDRKTL